ncbi:MAG: RagB/SusD family nutrient uptake outer membrane protein [Bacteroidota bacterium]
MKKLLNGITCLAIIAGAFSSCHKIVVPVTSQLTPEVYPLTDAQFSSASGPVYINLRSDFATTYFFLQSMTTDESLLPTYAADWVDGNRYLELHRHTWTKDNAVVGGGWNYLSNMIGTANQTISIINASAPPSDSKNTGLAELRTMRALAYFMMMDMYGNVPLDTLYGSTALKPNTPRAQVFTFIESELRNALPYLKSASGITTYGKPTKYMVYSLLAKMYLNAQVYTGTAKNNECIAACDSVINAGGGTQYALESRTTYLQQFYPTNGPTMKEFIFALPYDAATTNGNMFHARYDLNRNLGVRYLYSGSAPGAISTPIMNVASAGQVNNKPSGPRCTTPTYYAFFNDPGDIRNNQWLSGLQYWQDGTPIMVRTTNLGYDQFYAGGSPGAAYTYHLNLTPLTTSRLGATSYDLGKDEIAWNTGTRNIKFIADYTNPTSRNQNNDVPLFRYSDILLMKAEAIQRGGTPTLGATALSLVNLLRASRTTSAALGTITLDDIYAERCRELAWESWHRNDMIRFGKYETTYGLAKTNADTYRRIFPIPTGALTTNPSLVQNPGY